MARVRHHISVRGQVQGVGFRPFVYRLAAELLLGGLVGNDSHGAWVEIEGGEEAVGAFERRLREERPPLAQIYEVRSVNVPPREQSEFVIVSSHADPRQDVGITPDAAVCADCLREMFDPADRRYRYPFINCTNCGPRYSIIESVPYDRPNTTMRKFRMCERCQCEYDNPTDRRFHAQPNACSACGPRLWVADARGQPLDGDPIARVARMLRDGRIVAIKGIGGFHLACRADQDEPVELLRRRKGRETKPFAVMVPDLATARQIGQISERAASEMQCVERPIVLVPKREGSGGGVQGSGTTASCLGPGTRPPGPNAAGVKDRGHRPLLQLSERVAFDSPHVGLLLPYAPLHHLLFAEGLPPLVMTSGNPSEEPLTCENDEALQRLGGLADAFLLHDRDIARRVDDSVIIVSDEQVAPIRRARGYAPAGVLLDRAASVPVLAVGGELKTTICVYQGRDAVLSEHLGDLKSPATYRHFVATIEKLTELLRCEPECIACDLHPGYLSTQYALRQHKHVETVQHHHAHVVACMAENGVGGPVLGIACDGTGYGTDGAIWGCEMMVADEADFRRVGHLRYFALPGGDAAAKQTLRPALSLLKDSLDLRGAPTLSERVSREHGEELAAIEQMLKRGVNCPRTSSLGRLFDAVAFVTGVCERNGHEAQAAMALEEAAQRAWAQSDSVHLPPCEAYPFDVVRADGMIELDWRPAIRKIVADVEAGRDNHWIAAGFHETVAQMLAHGVDLLVSDFAVKAVTLTGGSFANQILLARTRKLLEQRGHQVHRRVPPGDGGLALGQAVVAAARIERARTCV
jgi:hydrogenase maturation protein HypF